MSKFGSLAAGLGLGAASGYLQKQDDAKRDARVAQITGKPLPPAEPSPLEQGIAKVKSLFGTDAAGDPGAVQALDDSSRAEAAQAYDAQDTAAPSADAWSQDFAAAPDQPTGFVSSIQDHRLDKP